MTTATLPCWPHVTTPMLSFFHFLTLPPGLDFPRMKGFWRPISASAPAPWLHSDIVALNPGGLRANGKLLNDTAQQIVLLQGPTATSAPLTALLRQYYPPSCPSSHTAKTGMPAGGACIFLARQNRRFLGYFGWSVHRGLTNTTRG